MHREALGQFLRSRRERTDPAELGLPLRNRRTPGLRRSEVAELANISEIHYTQIEQARGSQPSPDVLGAVARVLRFTTGETQHLFDLAEQAPPRPAEPAMELSGRTRQLIESLPVPVLVCSARLDVIGQNRASVELLEDFAAGRAADRNLARRHFLPPDHDDVWGSPGLNALSRFAAARLRSARARYPDDLTTRDLVDELRDRSERFEQMWQEAPVGFLRDTAVEVTEVRIGQATLTCEVTDIPERDQYLVFLPAAPDAPAGRDPDQLVG
ncbi:helix-turn-helix transcriptional regulator [Winogradskya consettensis]|uniref:Transcriptional regulator n=1 Tax=Winogradskya consettensis TaxID=113560 RepID=A0A919VSZ8_9ACTN|nr:helix-turn-helix transcriptional regulator [Actinoplanes consettensis]GIM75401.1 transcriptional regulator [Actinoplanes consettensis]